ncbi:ABC transporter ATP-binding protein/permease [Paenibacillus sp. N1-5-1-14]|uniref:ABC transporter ATP-binding protein n=1 Tax=Paenibacillus radicibacter TaxID=2972488 RepID=UPI002158B69B|nr:ABC transporter ATP-binding protein [Paenibacillus radicibacter]MCR8641685.1 ABC transporter ATP-binding protein/permease [Paenibacillus radicibacter]
MSKQAKLRLGGDQADLHQTGRFVYTDDEVIEQKFDWKQVRRLFSYMKPYAKQMLPIILIMMFIGAITKLTYPLIISYTIDHSLAKNNSDLLFVMVGLLLVVYIVQWVANMFRIKFTNMIGQNIIYDLRKHVFSHIQSLSFRFYDQRPAGSILIRVTNYVNSLQDLFTNGVVNLMIDCVQLIGIIVILLVINFKLGLAIIVTVPLMFLISTKLRRMIRRSWQLVQIKQARLNSHLNECIQGVRVTQAYSQEQENMKFFEGINKENRRVWYKATTVNQVMGPLVEITGALGYGILFLYGASLIEVKEISVGTLVAFSTYIAFFWDPINRLGQMYTQLLQAMASAERIFEFIDEKPTVAESEQAKDLPPIVGRVKLEDLVFAYEKNRPALKGISLDVEAGQSIALVGHTGSGKSTIINMICRFYDPTAGRVWIDGTDISQVSITSLRSQVGIVMQDTFIFAGSIRDNIDFGKPGSTDEEIIAAAKAVDAHDFIMKLPNGYDTEVEERGSMLSMGQRQLLSFARALLADPRILILDEATASIDTETEVKIQTALKTLLQGRTSFIVAHRLSTIRHADRIVVLDHGEIVEQGSHVELMHIKGTYHGLIESQYKYL